MRTHLQCLVYYRNMVASEHSERYSSSSPEVGTSPLGAGPTAGVCFLGWLVPGAGHMALGRWGRGVVFSIAILTMFVLGLVMNGHLYDAIPDQPLHLFAFAANIGAGLAYFLARSLGLGVGVLSSPDYDYGNTYLWVAGLLNYLVMLDAFDIAQGRKQ